jgi:uroporphyrinogen-III decarboxylase
MSPALFGKLVTPYMRKLAEVIHDGGLLCGIHCHGHVREVFPEMLKTGADLLEPIEPPDQGNITLAELMQQAEGRICLMGHIQDQEFYTAPPGHMTRQVEEIARVVHGRTGYIMSPTCTPFERPCSEIYARNYMEWLEAADRIFNG